VRWFQRDLMAAFKVYDEEIAVEVCRFAAIGAFQVSPANYVHCYSGFNFVVHPVRLVLFCLAVDLPWTRGW